MRPQCLYVHVPFCRQKCDYCSFHSVTNWAESSARAVLKHIITHLGLIRDSLSGCQTVYVGGGTPTAVPPIGNGSLDELLHEVRRGLPAVSEITVEANPETVTPDLLLLLADRGVTRLSVGVQSLDEAGLTQLGRRSVPFERLESIRKRWSGELGFDLIHAIPGVAPDRELNGASRILALQPEHLSVYDLSVDPGTPLAQRISRSNVDVDECWTELCELLASMRFERYEVSSFARQGYECRHNLAIWLGAEYAGLGPGAVSTVRGTEGYVRYLQSTDHARFLRTGHPLDFLPERLSPAERALEELMVGFRVAEGIPLSRLKVLGQRIGGTGADARLESALGREIGGGYLHPVGDGIAPTAIGMDQLNRMLIRLLQALEGHVH